MREGFSQRPGYDCQVDGTSSPVVNMSTVRMVLALASSRRLRLDQMDFETAYLNADLGDKV